MEAPTVTISPVMSAKDQPRCKFIEDTRCILADFSNMTEREFATIFGLLFSVYREIVLASDVGNGVEGIVMYLLGEQDVSDDRAIAELTSHLRDAMPQLVIVHPLIKSVERCD